MVIGLEKNIIINIMEVTIKGQTLPLHYSLRIYMIYENIVGESLSNIDANSMTSSASLVYATLVSTLKYNKIEDKLTLDEVIDFIDENGGMKFIAEFSKWFTDNVNREASLIAKKDEPEQPKEEPKKKSKK